MPGTHIFVVTLVENGLVEEEKLVLLAARQSDRPSQDGCAACKAEGRAVRSSINFEWTRVDRLPRTQANAHGRRALIDPVIHETINQAAGRITYPIRQDPCTCLVDCLGEAGEQEYSLRASSEHVFGS